jgi:hypothetical protein
MEVRASQGPWRLLPSWPMGSETSLLTNISNNSDQKGFLDILNIKNVQESCFVDSRYGFVDFFGCHKCSLYKSFDHLGEIASPKAMPVLFTLFEKCHISKKCPSAWHGRKITLWREQITSGREKEFCLLNTTANECQTNTTLVPHLFYRSAQDLEGKKRMHIN